MQDWVPPQTCYRSRPGRWGAEDIWPSPRIPPKKLALGPAGALGGALGKRRFARPCGWASALEKLGAVVMMTIGPPTNALMIRGRRSF
ncbi:MAG: hypothetical protein WCO04_02775 [Pseudomonadota bacterium]